MAEKDTRNVHQRILDTMKVVQQIEKTKRISLKGGGSYLVVTHDEVTKRCRGELLKQGVHYYSSVDSIAQSGNRTEVVVTTTFLTADPATYVDDAPHGLHPSDCFSVTMAGYGIDTGDKGPGKAISYASKYCLLKALGLMTGEDSDYHNEDYDADPDAVTPPELVEVTRQAKEGRLALVSAVTEWLAMDTKDKAMKPTAKKLAVGLNALIGVYYGPEGWFGKHLKAEHPDKLVDGNLNATIEKLTKAGVVNIFLKYRARAEEMALFNKYDHTLVETLIRAFNGSKLNTDIYSTSDEEFANMLQSIETGLKG